MYDKHSGYITSNPKEKQMTLEELRQEMKQIKTKMDELLTPISKRIGHIENQARSIKRTVGEIESKIITIRDQKKD